MHSLPRILIAASAAAALSFVAAPAFGAQPVDQPVDPPRLGSCVAQNNKADAALIKAKVDVEKAAKALAKALKANTDGEENTPAEDQAIADAKAAKVDADAKLVEAKVAAEVDHCKGADGAPGAPGQDAPPVDPPAGPADNFSQVDEVPVGAADTGDGSTA